MTCYHCGKENQDGTNFCMHCGVCMTDAEKDLNDTQKQPSTNNIETNIQKDKSLKRNIIIAVIMVVAVLVFILIGVIVHNNFRKNEAEFDSEQIYNDYIEINEEAIDIEGKYATDGFVHPEDISKVLDELEILAKEYKSKGLITSYDKQSDSIYFKLSNGVGYLYAPTVEGVLAGENFGKILTIEPYATKSEFVSNYLMGGKSPDEAAKKIVKALSDSYSFSKDDNWDSFSFEQVEQMGDHKIIIWYGHGNYSKECGSVLGTSIPITDQDTLLRYQLELHNGEMILGKKEFLITPSYFDNHLEDNSLDGSLVFLNTCKSAMDNRLADAFINKGASLVVGNSQTIRIRYMLYMMDDFMSALTNQYEDGTYWTAEDALAYAKSQNGDSDSEFWAYGAEVKLIYPENKSGYRLYGLEHTNNENSNQNTSTETTTSQQSETILSEECDMLLCMGYDGSDCYELVANQIDGYPDSTFEFGVIKNNEWLVEMSSTCPFINENGWWYGAEYSNTPGEFQYMRDGCFYYNHDDGWSEIIYKPETNISFKVSGIVSFSVYKTDSNTIDYSKLINENGEALTRLDDDHLTFSYLNLNTGESKPIPLELTMVNNNQYIGLLNDGVFYAHASSNFTGIDYSGFFDLNGNQIIDLTEYYCTDLGDYMFHNGQYTLTCKNNSDVEFNLTFDTSGKIILQEKADN